MLMQPISLDRSNLITWEGSLLLAQDYVTRDRKISSWLEHGCPSKSTHDGGFKIVKPGLDLFIHPTSNEIRTSTTALASIF
jgi:hypothetical protein